jgi:hypothetical protein
MLDERWPCQPACFLDAHLSEDFMAAGVDRVLLGTIGHPWIDESEAPILHLTYPRQTTLAELEKYYEAVGAFLERLDTQVAWLVDCTHIIAANAEQRRYVAEQEAKYKEIQEKYYVASGLYVANAMTRGIITAVFWLSPPPYPYKIFSSRAPAHAYVTDAMAMAIAKRATQPT